MSVVTTRRLGLIGGGLALAVSLGLSPLAHAQLDSLKNSLGGLGGSSTGSSGLPSLSSMSSSSMGNATGVLEFCIKNNYLSGSNLTSATGVKDQLMGKLTGESGSPAQSPGYLDGAKGLLSSSDGKTVDLNGGGLKQQLTKQVCDKVLSQAKSFL